MSFKLNIGLVIYPGFTQLDVTGPFEVFARIPHASVYIIAPTGEPCRSDTGLELVPTHTFEDAPPLDVLCVSGGPGQVAMMQDDELIGFLREQAARADWVVSICTGAFLLGAAGLLEGYRATTHWSAIDQLEWFGAMAVEERFVFDRNRATSAGVTAGIDLALALARKLDGDVLSKAIQLGLEYDPSPPHDSGNPWRAPTEIRDAVERFAASSWSRRRESNEQFLRSEA